MKKEFVTPELEVNEVAFEPITDDDTGGAGNSNLTWD